MKAYDISLEIFGNIHAIVLSHGSFTTNKSQTRLKLSFSILHPVENHLLYLLKTSKPKNQTI